MSGKLGPLFLPNPSLWNLDSGGVNSSKYSSHGFPGGCHIVQPKVTVFVFLPFSDTQQLQCQCCTTHAIAPEEESQSWSLWCG